MALGLLFPLRIAQGIFAIVVLGLSAYGKTSFHKSNCRVTKCDARVSPDNEALVQEKDRDIAVKKVY